MDQIVKVELVDLTGIKLTEPVPDVVEQPAKLLLVISGDRLACRPPLGFFVRIRPLGHRGEATPKTARGAQEGRGVPPLIRSPGSHGTKSLLDHLVGE
jgi:hypothetical protein